MVKLLHFIFQRWLTSVGAKPGLNKMMLDMLGRRCKEDQTKHEFVTLVLDAMAIKKNCSTIPKLKQCQGLWIWGID